ncbi:hypothetical protein JCM11491_007192 [Sporobolomyces phaffii]
MRLSAGPTLSQQDILSLPRPGAPVVNPSGTHAVWPSSEYDFASSRTARQFTLVDLASNESRVVATDLDQLDVAWLDDDTIVYLSAVKLTSESESAAPHPAAIDRTRVWALDVRDPTESRYLLAEFPVPVANVSTRVSGPDAAVLAFSAAVFPNPASTLYTYPSEYADHVRDQQGSDIRVYDSTFVRHWDTWTPTTRERTQVFVVRLSKNPQEFAASPNSDTSDDDDDGFEQIDAREGRWACERETEPVPARVDHEHEHEHRPKVIAPLQGTKLECPVGPFGSTADYSLSPNGRHVAFHSKDPHVSPSWHTRTNVYLASLSPRSHADQEPKLLSIGTQGASSSVAFSPDGHRVAWLEMRQDGYEADRNRVMVYDIETHERTGLTESWDASPSHLEWTREGDKLLATTEERGHVVLYEIDAPRRVQNGAPADLAKGPRKLTDRDSVSSASALGGEKVLVAINSFTHPNELYLVNPVDASDDAASHPQPTLVASLTRDLLSTKTLSTGEEFVFLGSEGQEVHGWILFPAPSSAPALAQPSSESRQPLLPLANLCHGGPQSAWTSSWSTRWNPQSYTANGYATVLINRTGSTGFGQAFCDRIKEDWGGAPFRDIVAGIEFVKKTWKDRIDPERMASLGASYGGYMQNWIQGHNDALGFKCLVTHDGVFSLAQTYYSTEELYFPTREFGGAPWEVPSNYAQFSPDKFIANWKTPHLVIHGSRDYRLVESEGLGVFNTLQRLGIPSRLLIFPSENHWVLSPPNSLKWHQEVFRFIGEFTNTA